MCGRFVFQSPSSRVVDLFGVRHVLGDFGPSWNIAPGQDVPILLCPEGELLLAGFRWGLIPPWAKNASVGYKMINARSETVQQKASFRQAFQARRCIIVADGFYEWKKIGTKKQPMFIYRETGDLLAMAGIWERWHAGPQQRVDSFAILTTEANDWIQPVHDRMPVFLDKEEAIRWMEPRTSNEELTSLMRPAEVAGWAMHPVDAKVGSPKYNSPDCIKPIPLSLMPSDSQMTLFS